MLSIETHFSKHKCKTCGNLSYWDGYFCKLGKHQTKKEKLSMTPLKECDSYVKRQGSNWDTCKDQECVFWCLECSAYKNK